MVHRIIFGVGEVKQVELRCWLGVWESRKLYIQAETIPVELHLAKVNTTTIPCFLASSEAVLSSLWLLCIYGLRQTISKSTALSSTAFALRTPLTLEDSTF